MKKSLSSFVKPYTGLILLMISLGALSSLADSVYPLFNRFALEHFVAGRTLRGLGLFVALDLALLVFQALDNYFAMYLSGKVEMSIDRDLRNASFNHLQTLSFSYFNRNNVGYIHARVMSDTGKIGMLFSWRLMDIIWDGSYLVFIMLMMLIVSPYLALSLIALLPVTALVSWFFQKKLVGLNRRVRESNAKIVSSFNEGITGVKSIKTLVIEERMSGDFRRDSDAYRRNAVGAAHYSALFISAVTLTSSIALALVLQMSGRLDLEGFALIGRLSVFMSYALGMMEPVQNLIRTISAVIEIRVNIERFLKLMNTVSDVTDTPEVISRYGDTFNPKRENWEELKGDIEFQDVSFHYPDGDELVLEHFSLKVPKGSSVAIVGETGAGKTTLVNLVCRFFEPTGGRILIDGRDVRDRSQLWLHSNLGYVLQTPYLFSGTVRENLLYGCPGADDDRIKEALKLVCADQVTEKIAGGLDGQVGEGGEALSTGEKQLLSFARAMLSDPAILILDEATSSVDTMTEKNIQNAIREVTRGRTSFMIAHRLSTIIQADMILVVRDGRIAESGTHDGLMKKRGYYYDLYTSQGF